MIGVCTGAEQLAGGTRGVLHENAIADGERGPQGKD